MTLYPKLVVRNSWNLKSYWDTTLLEEIQTGFEVWVAKMPLLYEVRIPRCLTHGWGQKNNGAYIPFVMQAGWLMLPKFLLDQQWGGNHANDSSQDSDCALQNITIPTLELLACCIKECLTTSIRERDRFGEYSCLLLDTLLYRKDYWGSFVNNHMNAIQSLTLKKGWIHVPGDLNPANLSSWGYSLGVFLSSSCWEGLPWLKKGEEVWPKREVQFDEEILKRKRTGVIPILPQY